MAIKFDITGDNTNFLNSLQEVQNKVRETAKMVDGQGSSIEEMFTRIKVAAAGALAGLSAKAFIQQVVQIRGQFQQLEAAFTTLLGSAEKASKMMQDMTKLAATTPFDLKGVALGAQQLLAYGVAADDITDTLTRLGDIAAGLSLPLNDLVYLYGTTLTQGRMYTQDLRQFMGRGIPLAEELAKQFGVTKDKVGELVTEGKVGAEEFKKAIKSMSDEGGKFGGLMDMQSKTISGQISNISDNIDMMFNNIGKQSESIINETLEGIGTLVENYETVGKAIAGLVATYGMYKAAVITVTAIQGLQTAGIGALSVAEAAHYGWIVLVEKAQKLLNATMLANPYVLVATAIAGIVAVMMTMKSQQDLVNEATEEYNREKDEAIKKEQEHAAEIDKLCQIAGDESLATDTRKEALVRLIQQYPSVFKKYKTEIEMLGHIRDIKLEIARLDGQKSIQKPQNQLADVEKHIGELEGKTRMETFTGRNGSSYTKEVSARSKKEEAELISLRRRRAELNKQIEKDSANTYLKDLPGVSDADLRKQINERKNLIAKMDVDGKKYGKVRTGGAKGAYNKDELQGQLTLLQAEQNRRKQVLSDGSKDFTAEVRKAYNREKKALDNLHTLTDPKKRAKSTLTVDVGGKKKKVSELTSTEYEDAVTKQQKATDEAAKKLKGLTGSSIASENAAAKKAQTAATKAETEAAQRAENTKEENERWREEQLKQQREAQYALEEAEIASIRNSAERERRERKLQHQKDLDQLDDQKREFQRQNYEHDKKLFENSGKDKKNKFTGSVETTALTQDQQTQLDAQKKKIEAEWAQYREEQEKADLQSLYEYYQEYGSFEQKRLALTEEYAQKIADAENEGEKKRLEKERDKKLSSLSYEDISMGIDWQSLFSGIGSMTTDMMQEMQKKLQAFVKTDDYRNADSQTQRDIADLLSTMRQYLGSDQNVTWQSLVAAMDNFNKAITEYQSAQAAEKAAIAARDDARTRHDKGEISDEEYQKYVEAANAAGEATADARKEVEQFGNTLNDTSDELAHHTSKLTAALNKLEGWSNTEGFDEVVTAIHGTDTGDGTKGGLDGLKADIDKVLPGLDGQNKEFLEGLGKILENDDKKDEDGNATGIMNIGTKLTDLMGKGMGSVIGIVAQIPKIILQIASAIKNYVTGILDSFTELFKLRWIDDLVNSILEAVGNLINAIFDLPENLYHVLEAIVVNGVGGLLNTIVGRIGNILSFGALSSKGPADWFTNSNAKEVAEATERLTKENEALTNAIDRLKESIDESGGREAVEDYQQAYEDTKALIENQMEILREQMSYHGSHHSNAYYWNLDESDYAAINRTLADYASRHPDAETRRDSAYSLSDIYELTPEQMEAISAHNIEIWQKMLDAGKYDKSEYWEKYIEYAGQLEELTEKISENLTQTSFDTLKSNFVSDIMDMEKTAEDFSDDFTEMIAKAWTNAAVSDLMKDDLQDFYDTWFAKMKAGTLTNADIEQLRKEYDDLAAQALNIRDTMSSVTGYTGKDEEQKASANGVSDITYDQASSFIGLVTAGNIVRQNIADGVTSMVSNLSMLASSASARNTALSEMRNLMIYNNSYLEDILKINKSFYNDFVEKMDRVTGKLDKL